MNDMKRPTIDPSAYVAPNATIRGDVTLGAESSIWHGCVLHADVQPVRIGKRSSLQELCCVHVGWEMPTIVGDDVTVGHGCILHGCTIEDCCTIGMGAIVMDGARVGRGSFIGAGALVTENMQIPPNSVVMGVPAKVRRESTEAERLNTMRSVEHYVREAAKELAGRKREER